MNDEIQAIKQEIAEVDLNIKRLQQHRINLAAKLKRKQRDYRFKQFKADRGSRDAARYDNQVIMVEDIRPHIESGLREVYGGNLTQFCLKTGFDPRYVRAIRNSARKKYITFSVADELLTALDRYDALEDIQVYNRWSHEPE